MNKFRNSLLASQWLHSPVGFGLFEWLDIAVIVSGWIRWLLSTLRNCKLQCCTDEPDDMHICSWPFLRLFFYYHVEHSCLGALCSRMFLLSGILCQQKSGYDSSGVCIFFLCFTTLIVANIGISRCHCAKSVKPLSFNVGFVCYTWTQENVMYTWRLGVKAKDLISVGGRP